MTHVPTTTATPRWVAMAIAMMMATTGWLALHGAAPAAADQSQITEGSMTWGMKASWRAYTGTGELSGGVKLNDSGEYVFPLVTGQYDSASRSTKVSFRGSVQWKNHYYPNETHVLSPPAGYTGPLDIYVLDVTISDPEVTITAEGSTLTAHVVSRDMGSWIMKDRGRIDFADLDINGIAPSNDAATTSWAGIPAALTQLTADEVFGGQYKAAQAIDPVSMTYTGPGAAPDLSEQWDQAGAPSIGRTANTLLFDGSSNSLYPWWNDLDNGIVHARKSAGGTSFFAFDTTTMQQLGTATALPATVGSPSFVDPVRQRAYFRSNNSTIDSYVQWDAQTATYSQHTLAQPVSTTPLLTTLLWDSKRRVGYSTVRHVPAGVDETDYDHHVWELHVVTETDDGVFNERELALPNGPAGWNESWNVLESGRSTILSDGSILVPPLVATPVGDDPAAVDQFSAQRIVVAGDSATVSDVPGTASPRILNAISDRAGRAALVYPAGGQGSATVQQLRLDGDGLVPVGAQLSLGSLNARAFAFDPTNGTLWAHAVASQELVMIRDGELVGAHKDSLLNIRAPFVSVGNDHTVYVASSDGQQYSFIKPYKYGFASFRLNGFVPKIADQPDDTTVTLQQDETDAEATFTVEVDGTPSPTVQWQVKAPGKTRFVDVVGADAATLKIAAGRSSDGAQYRAIVSSSAGRLATDVATLTVDSAPTFGLGLASQRVTADSDAMFSVLASGSPEPDIQWQRRIDGFWQNIGDGDDNFAVTDGSLTVRSTNIDQSGATFRARARNSVGTVYSKTVTLTVVPKVQIPDEGLDLDGVSMQWSGSAELQKAPPSGGSNFFSAGESDGTESTYRNTDGAVKIVQVAPGGARSQPTWSTKAAHVDGGQQLVQLGDGTAHLDPDGSATVDWDGAFSVNFYGGMVPFTVTDPELTVHADGTGTLTGDLSGYASTQANPGVRDRLDPVPDVTIATFDGVEIDPDGVVTITPDYDGVEIATPNGQTAQNRDVDGWGSWPQEFVDVHFATGLSSYWYSSGGAADPLKKASPFTVDFGAGHPSPPATDTASTTTVTLGGRTYAYGSSTTATIRVSTATTAPSGLVDVTVGGRTIPALLVLGMAAIDLPAGLTPGSYSLGVDYPGATGIKGSRAETSFTVTRAKPRISAKPIRAHVTAGRRAKLKIAVALPGGSGIRPVGQIVIHDGRKIIKIKQLRNGHHGRVTVTLPKLDRGKHHLRATIGSTPLLKSSTTAYKTITVR